MQLAKAGEHLAVAELILQGYNAFIADAQLPYDIIIDFGNGEFGRVQVKSTCDMMQAPPNSKRKFYHPVYRFAIRRSRQEDRRIKGGLCDYFAFVALDIRRVAFVKHGASLSPSDAAYSKSLIEFKSKSFNYERQGPTGPDPNISGKFIEDYHTFNR